MTSDPTVDWLSTVFRRLGVTKDKERDLGQIKRRLQAKHVTIPLDISEWTCENLNYFLKHFGILAEAKADGLLVRGVDGPSIALLFGCVPNTPMNTAAVKGFAKQNSLSQEELDFVMNCITGFYDRPELPTYLTKSDGIPMSSLRKKECLDLIQWLRECTDFPLTPELEGRLMCRGLNGHVLDLIIHTLKEKEAIDTLKQFLGSEERARQLFDCTRGYSEKKEEDRILSLIESADFSRDVFGWMPVKMKQFEQWDMAEVIEWLNSFGEDSPLINPRTGKIWYSLDCFLHICGLNGMLLSVACGCYSDPRWSAVLDAAHSSADSSGVRNIHDLDLHWYSHHYGFDQIIDNSGVGGSDGTSSKDLTIAEAEEQYELNVPGINIYERPELKFVEPMLLDELTTMVQLKMDDRMNEYEGKSKRKPVAQSSKNKSQRLKNLDDNLLMIEMGKDLKSIRDGYISFGAVIKEKAPESFSDWLLDRNCTDHDLIMLCERNGLVSSYERWWLRREEGKFRNQQREKGTRTKSSSRSRTESLRARLSISVINGIPELPADEKQQLMELQSTVCALSPFWKKYTRVPTAVEKYENHVRDLKRRKVENGELDLSLLGLDQSTLRSMLYNREYDLGEYHPPLEIREWLE